MRRTERLFALAEHLRARRSGVTAEALAERFDVSLRTIYRDLDSLRAASLPLQAERGRGGGYALDRSYSLPPVNFTAREAALLLVAGRFLSEMRILPFSTALERALDKVRAALPASAQRDLDKLEKKIAFVGVPAHAVSVAVREAVEAAFFEGRPLKIRYDGREKITERTIKIEQIVLERTETILNTMDLEKGEPRQFRLHRVLSVEVI